MSVSHGISCSIALAALSCCCGAPKDQQTRWNPHLGKEESMPNADEGPEIMPCIDYLSLIGDRLGCHFTLEYQSPSVTGQFPEVKSAITNEAGITSVSSLMSKLRNSLKGFIVTRDSRNPLILHVIERALQGQKGYVLDERISLEYSGNLVGCVVKDEQGRDLVNGEGLVTAIAKQVAGIQSGPASPDGLDAFDDCLTVVEVKATNEAIRSILTDHLPLTNYASILWRGVTTIESGKTSVMVQFYGPRN
jgi:hypothetical protein